MEIKSSCSFSNRVVKVFYILLISMLANLPGFAQSTAGFYTIRDGKMQIRINKKSNESSLDSFIAKYNLEELKLKEFILKNFLDSITNAGWVIVNNTPEYFSIIKPLFSFEDINNAADKILFTGKNPSLASRFPAVSPGVVYGYNRFKRKSFAEKDSALTFFLRGIPWANEVILSGSFVNWSPTALKMRKTDSGWIATVNLRPGKYWYKFIIDGHWHTDDDNFLRENDGLGNINSVVYKTNTLFRFNALPNSKKVYLTGSFNQWDPKGLEMKKTATGWELPLYLADGTHTYRFLADEKFYTDPLNPEKQANELGEFNSVLSIGKKYKFRLENNLQAKNVFVSGNFNEWKRNELLMNKVGNGWELMYTLGPGNYFYSFIIDGKDQKKEKELLIIEPNYTFRLKGYPHAGKVFLAGDFNDWEPGVIPMKKEGDDWVFSLHLSAGKHLYKFIVDGKWIQDPANEFWEDNRFGTGDSVIWIEN